ncbi:hypothetical protein [Vagococcus silagei]|uniref:Uncharacterized protein n=1 Tax=Vagococcus silagei TaxID=2508885 RepID=A0A4S3B370_9ENTE|nr:hypothetical protein [Vagococcus silagei]THB60677.1 hypothetical protein ESZ54_08765 [Vagococcus silagei]
MIRKEKVKKEEHDTTSQDQILTRSRVKEFQKTKKRNKWLNTAIIVVAILLAIMAYAVLNL